MFTIWLQHIVRGWDVIPSHAQLRGVCRGTVSVHLGTPQMYMIKCYDMGLDKKKKGVLGAFQAVAKCALGCKMDG